MALIHIASVTASASATLSFTSGIDATYNEYQFHFVNIHPATDNVDFEFQVNAAGQSGFNETITSTVFDAWHFDTEDGSSDYALTIQDAHDQAQGTTYQEILGYSMGNGDAKYSCSGVLTLYNPASKTSVKQFTAVGQSIHSAGITLSIHTAGYINTTAPIDEISFAMESGNIDAGQIKMYGIAKA
jgi:hypothetical protein